LTVSLLTFILAVPASDLVETHLPGCNTDVHQFSGYLKVSSTKELHYILVES